MQLSKMETKIELLRKRLKRFVDLICYVNDGPSPFSYRYKTPCRSLSILTPISPLRIIKSSRTLSFRLQN